MCQYRVNSGRRNRLTRQLCMPECGAQKPSNPPQGRLQPTDDRSSIIPRHQRTSRRRQPRCRFPLRSGCVLLISGHSQPAAILSRTRLRDISSRQAILDDKPPDSICPSHCSFQDSKTIHHRTQPTMSLLRSTAADLVDFAQRQVDRIAPKESRQKAYSRTKDFATARPLLFVRP